MFTERRNVDIQSVLLEGFSVFRKASGTGLNEVKQTLGSRLVAISGIQLFSHLEALRFPRLLEIKQKEIDQKARFLGHLGTLFVVKAIEHEVPSTTEAITVDISASSLKKDEDSGANYLELVPSEKDQEVLMEERRGITEAINNVGHVNFVWPEYSPNVTIGYAPAGSRTDYLETIRSSINHTIEANGLGVNLSEPQF